jgi:hypothetical protein
LLDRLRPRDRPVGVERGFRTVITARNPSSLEDFAAADNALILELDVTKPSRSPA